MPNQSRSPSSRECCESDRGDGQPFDLAILGGGSAAFAAARRASDLGAQVLMVNDGLIGGTCVNVGCVPSKTLIRAAENHHANQTSRFRGVKPEPGWFEGLADRIGLTDRLTHRPAELSGGQQQRVAIARALVSRPTVVFADEPTGNLDSTTSHEILELMRASVDELGQTMVMVTHDPRAAAMADRVLFLADGRIVNDIPRSSQHEILQAMEALIPA